MRGFRGGKRSKRTRVNVICRCGRPGAFSLAFFILTLWASGPGTAQARLSTNLEAGFLYHSFPLTLSLGARQEVLGPLFSHQQRESEEEWAFHPLVSFARDSSADYSEFHLLS